MLAASLYLIYERRFLAIGAPDRGAGILLSWTTLTSPHLPTDYLSPSGYTLDRMYILTLSLYF